MTSIATIIPDGPGSEIYICTDGWSHSYNTDRTIIGIPFDDMIKSIEITGDCESDMDLEYLILDHTMPENVITTVKSRQSRIVFNHASLNPNVTNSVTGSDIIFTLSKGNLCIIHCKTVAASNEFRRKIYTCSIEYHNEKERVHIIHSSVKFILNQLKFKGTVKIRGVCDDVDEIDYVIGL
jgi:hypothetical protein